MITVTWSLASGDKGEVTLEGDQKWTFGRVEGDTDAYTLATDESSVSRNALVIRDSGPGPVVFRGQRDNGAQVGVLHTSGTTDWLAEGTAHNLTADDRQIEFYNGEELFLTVSVAFDERPTVLERQRQQG